MNILEIKNFSKTYKGNKKAVDNLSITVEAGDIYGFIGHNGAGKSTTIKSVVGVLEFTEGEIYIDGHSVKKEPMECKSITAYIPDNPDIYEAIAKRYLNIGCACMMNNQKRIDLLDELIDEYKIELLLSGEYDKNYANM